MITLPNRIHDMVLEVSEYLDSQGYDDIRIEITASGIYVQRKDAMRAHRERRFQR